MPLPPDREYCAVTVDGGLRNAIRRMKRKSKINKADSLWSKIIRKRGKCERCGRTTNLQAAHIISRTHKNTRWDLENGLCLCGGCHIFWAHKEPLEFAEFVKEKLGEKYNDLRVRGQMNGKGIDMEAIIIYLESQL